VYTGLRIPVAAVLAMMADGMMPEGIIGDLAERTVEDVSEAPRFAAEAVREGELSLRNSVRGSWSTTSLSGAERFTPDMAAPPAKARCR
jgi:hypothetical protein